MAKYDININGFHYNTKEGWKWYEEANPNPFTE